MRKKLLAIITASIMAMSILAGCAKQEEAVTAKVAALNGPTGMGLVKMMDDEKDTDNYEFTLVGAPDEITAKLVKGEYDIAAVPANLASVLYNNTGGNIQTLAVNTLGVLYIVENGNTVKSVSDLKGKTIYASGKGSTPEYALNYILEQNGIDPAKDVTIEYKSEHAECLSAMAADENGIAMLPQPFVTVAMTKNPNIRVAIDLNEEWDKLNAKDNESGSLITGVVVARKDFVEKYPEKTKSFLEEYKSSVEFTNNNIDEAAALIGENDIVPEAVAKKAIPECNITFISGDEMKTKLSGYLKVLSEANPKAVGGKLPGDDFYYVEQ